MISSLLVLLLVSSLIPIPILFDLQEKKQREEEVQNLREFRL